MLTYTLLKVKREESLAIIVSIIISKARALAIIIIILKGALKEEL